jgi:hypothetical protein
MAHDLKLHLQVADGHLRLVSRGNLTDLGIKRILRATEAGLQVFPLVIVDLQESKGIKQNIVTLLEEGLRQLIAQRKQALGKARGEAPGKPTSLLPKPAAGMAKDNGPPNRPNPAGNQDNRPVRLIWNRADISL